MSSPELLKDSFKSSVLSGHISDFEEHALQLFRFQAVHNEVYRTYLNHRKISPETVTSIEKIPFLPISFFKTQKILTAASTKDVKMVFESSSTTGSIPSRHYIADPEFYLTHAAMLFEKLYGKLENTVILALLPSYLERQGSSLVLMIDRFISATQNTLSGFFLNKGAQLSESLAQAGNTGKDIILWGVTFALLDLAETRPPDMAGVTIIETGGMKGRGREPLREELHQTLAKGLGTDRIHSEYGMTELLSQAYARHNGIFTPAHSMKILVREPEDPFAISSVKGRGGINVIDLANVDSCAFIETQDLGELNADGTFKILGRLDQAEIRGCSLLTA